jgi:hypothetical protein
VAKCESRRLFLHTPLCFIYDSYCERDKEKDIIMSTINIRSRKTGTPVEIDIGATYRILRKEYVAITGDTTAALVLEYLIRASVFYCKVDRAVEDYISRGTLQKGPLLGDLPSDGWFYRSTKSIAEQCLLYKEGKLTTRVVETRIDALCALGFIEKKVQGFPRGILLPSEFRSTM